jgi:hypothetical protein
MKKVFVLLMLLAVRAAGANHGSSDFRLDVFGNTWFSVAVDNRYYGPPDRTFELRGLAPGTHFVEVFGFGNNPHGPGLYSKPLYRGYVELPAASVVTARVNKFLQLNVKHIVPRFIAPPVCGPVPPALFPMGDGAFGELLRTIDRQPFDSSRLLIAKQGIGPGLVTAAQVRRLMEAMAFESTRLELAKFAYGHVIDKERFYIVNDAFTFSSSIRDLDRYVQRFG